MSSSATAADLREALLANLTDARGKCRSQEYHDLTHLRKGGQLPTQETNPFAIEFAALVAAVVEEDPAWCADCAHAGGGCGGDCGGSFWGPDWGSVQAAAFDTEAKALGIKCRGVGWVVVPSVDFFGPRTPEKELGVLREHLDWAYQDYAQGRDPDGAGYEAASAAASAFEAEYVSRLRL